MMWTPDSPTAIPRLYAQVALDAELIVVAAGLIVLIIAGGFGIIRIKRWRQEDKPTLQDQLVNYQQLQEQGLLQPQELERIKMRLESKARQQAQDQSTTASPQPPDNPWPFPPADHGGPSHG